MSVGIVGRGWRAILSSAVPAAAAILVTWPFSGDDAAIPAASQTCDPGCIPLEGAVGAAAVAAALLAALGIALRRLAGRL